MIPQLRLLSGALRPFYKARVRPNVKISAVHCSSVNCATELQRTKNKWITFRAVFTRWMPLGSVMYVSWCYFRGKSSNVSKVEIKCYEMLPFRITSRIWGKLASYEVPTPLRPYVYGTYVWMFSVNLDEAACSDLTQYKSLSAFFTRPLKDGARIIQPQPCVSPCDGVVLNCGPVDSEHIEQVKGVTYNLKSFLEGNRSSGDGVNFYRSLLKNRNNILHQCTIYLAPGDYHRFHSPVEWIARLRRHFSGKLLSVNPWIAGLIPGLFCLNERAVYLGEWYHGFFSMTAVGATNVGSIEIFADKDLQTNVKRKWKNEMDELDLHGIKFVKGELFGQFNMGSTIVLLFEAPRDFKFNIEAGDRVRVGQALSFFGKPQIR